MMGNKSTATKDNQSAGTDASRKGKQSGWQSFNVHCSLLPHNETQVHTKGNKSLCHTIQVAVSDTWLQFGEQKVGSISVVGRIGKGLERAERETVRYELQKGLQRVIQESPRAFESGGERHQFWFSSLLASPAEFGQTGSGDGTGKDEKVSEQKEIAAFFADLPAEGKPRLLVLLERIDQFRDAARAPLQAALAEFIQSRTPEDHGQKQQIVETINAALMRLGLAIRYDGQACYLAATVGEEYPRGRFLIVPKGAKTPLLTRTHLAGLPTLELMDVVRQQDLAAPGASAEEQKHRARENSRRSKRPPPQR